MAKVQIQFGHDYEELSAGRDQKQLNELYKSDPKFHKATNDLTTKFTNDWTDLKIEMLKLRGTASRLANPPTQPATPKANPQ